MYIIKQIKSIYHKINLTMSYNNMRIENVVPKLINEYAPYSIKKLQTGYMFYQKIKMNYITI